MNAVTIADTAASDRALDTAIAHGFAALTAAGIKRPESWSSKEMGAKSMQTTAAAWRLAARTAGVGPAQFDDAIARYLATTDSPWWPLPVVILRLAGEPARAGGDDTNPAPLFNSLSAEERDIVDRQYRAQFDGTPHDGPAYIAAVEALARRLRLVPAFGALPPHTRWAVLRQAEQDGVLWGSEATVRGIQAAATRTIAATPSTRRPLLQVVS